MGFDRKYLVWALGYVVLGMGLGIFMAASHNHAQRGTHAHILLVGFVVPLIYAVVHKLWLGEKPPRFAKLQFIMHQIGAATMFAGLFMLLGDIVPETQIAPVLATGSIVVFSAALLMIFMVYRDNVVRT